MRLRSLRTEPDAYGSSYDIEAPFTLEQWQDRLHPDGHPHFAAEGPDGAAVGLSAGIRDGDDVLLVAMWVEPDARGTGVAADLVAAVVDWAETNGFRRVRLDVTEGNVVAERLYQRLGFHHTGHRRVRERDGLIEIEMAMALS